MVELIGDTLVFSFPDVHPRARLTVTFQRTLRIPDNGKTYPLPPGLGAFPLKHVDDFAREVPPDWAAHGGVMLPMYQSEALWLRFKSDWIAGNGTEYPFAVKIAAGKINAVTGQPWSNGLHTDAAGLRRRARPAVDRRLCRREGRHPAIRRDAAGQRLLGGRADHRRRRARRPADPRVADEARGVRSALPDSRSECPPST